MPTLKNRSGSGSSPLAIATAEQGRMKAHLGLGGGGGGPFSSPNTTTTAAAGEGAGGSSSGSISSGGGISSGRRRRTSPTAFTFSPLSPDGGGFGFRNATLSSPLGSPRSPTHGRRGALLLAAYALSLAVICGATLMVALGGMPHPRDGDSGAAVVGPTLLAERVGRLEQEAKELRSRHQGAVGREEEEEHREHRRANDKKHEHKHKKNISQNKDEGPRVNADEKQGKEGTTSTMKPWSKVWERTRFTPASFVVAGVDLAGYNIVSQAVASTTTSAKEQTPPYELYEDFDISARLTGNESWDDLVAIRRRFLKSPSLAFYVDGVAQARWMPKVQIPRVKPFVVKYRHELTDVVDPANGEDGDVGARRTERGKKKKRKEESQAIRDAISDLLPSRSIGVGYGSGGGPGYAAKPSHVRRPHGVLLVERMADGTARLGRGGHRLRRIPRITAKTTAATAVAGAGASKEGDPPKDNDAGEAADREVSKALTSNLLDGNQAKPYESHVGHHHVKPGFLITERYVSGNDGGLPQSTRSSSWQPPDEFRLYCVWGRVYAAQWLVGSSHRGVVSRDGAVIVEGDGGGAVDAAALPDWVDWNEAVRIAETLADRKDMLRVDVLVGVPAGSSSPVTSEAKEGRPTTESKATTTDGAQVRVVVSDTDIYPGGRAEAGTRRLHRMLEEGARLWIAGYRRGNYRVVENTEVPSEFLRNGWLA